MKGITIISLILTFALSGCTTVSTSTGTRLSTSGDIKGLRMTSETVEAQSIEHSGLWGQVNKSINALGLGFLAL